MDIEINKILILSAYTKEVIWNNYGKCDFGEVATINHKEYAETHGYSYHCEIVDETNFPDMHPTWVKIYVIRKFLELYDYVVWLDADAIYLNKNLSIFDIVKDSETNLIVPKADLDIENDIVWTGISTGFMIFKNTQWSIELLDSMINYNGHLKANNGFHEQEYLSNLILNLYVSENPSADTVWYKSKIDLVETKLIAGGMIEILPYRYHRTYNYLETDYIFHAAGNTPTKLERIKEALGLAW